MIPKKAKELNGAVLVFVRSVEKALKIAESLDKGVDKGKVLSLTGTMRGWERDNLVKNPISQQFIGSHDTPIRARVFLVCTSAGEVGINISADHCVCDLSTYESMAQRFGRVNRFGERDDSSITVLYEKTFNTKDKKVGAMEFARAATLALLQKLPKADAADDIYAASPAALETLPSADRTAAFSHPPEIRVATHIQFDAWALTSIREQIAARPPVAPYLHGETEWQPPETHVAWRDDRDFDHRRATPPFSSRTLLFDLQKADKRPDLHWRWPVFRPRSLCRAPRAGNGGDGLTRNLPRYSEEGRGDSVGGSD